MAIDFNTGKDQSAAGYLYSLQYFFFSYSGSGYQLIGAQHKQWHTKPLSPLFRFAVFPHRASTK